jgi:hypothetical protein
MGARRQKRLKTVLPVRLGGVNGAGKPFMAMAHTIDISRSGARVGGVVALLKQGTTVEVQCRHRKASLRSRGSVAATSNNLGFALSSP